MEVYRIGFMIEIAWNSRVITRVAYLHMENLTANFSPDMCSYYVLDERIHNCWVS